jgi:hypothetical protein
LNRSKKAPTSKSKIIAAEVIEDLQAALAQFAAVTDAEQRPGFPQSLPI